MSTIQWKLFTDGEGDPHIIVSERGVDRMATKAECERAIGILNEEGSNLIRLYCRNAACKENGKGWIERARDDVSKNMYACDVCGVRMDR